jgi:hypothetical protein
LFCFIAFWGVVPQQGEFKNTASGYVKIVYQKQKIRSAIPKKDVGLHSVFAICFMFYARGGKHTVKNVPRFFVWPWCLSSEEPINRVEVHHFFRVPLGSWHLDWGINIGIGLFGPWTTKSELWVWHR